MCDYYDLRVTCTDCELKAWAASAELDCRKDIGTRGAMLAAHNTLKGYGEATVGVIAITWGGYLILSGGGAVVGSVIFVIGVGLAAKGVVDAGRSLDIVNKANAAADLFCNCEKRVE